jgi:hypothetical protein
VPAPQLSRQRRHNNPWAPLLHLAVDPSCANAIRGAGSGDGQESEEGVDESSDAIKPGCARMPVLAMLLEHAERESTTARFLGEVDAEGRTALHVAAKHVALSVPGESGVADRSANTSVRGPKCDALSCLLLAGANPNARDEAGCAPLHVAAASGCLACVANLLERGAEPSLKAKDGRSAVDFAAKRKSNECYEMLQAAIKERGPTVSCIYVAPFVDVPSAPPEGGNPKSKSSCNHYNSTVGCQRTTCCFGHFCSICGFQHAHSSSSHSGCTQLVELNR